MAHFFGGGKSAPTSAIVATSSPLPTVTPAIAAVPLRRFTPLPSPSPSPTPSPRRHPTTSPSPAAAVTPTPVESAAPSSEPSVRPTLRPTPAPSLAPKPAPGAKAADDRASAVVRAYLVALSNNDRGAAARYLAQGTPTETFMTQNAHIESIRSVKAGPEQYRVGADVQSSSGEYYVTFTVEAGPGGLQITDHYTVKPL